MLIYIELDTQELLHLCHNSKLTKIHTEPTIVQLIKFQMDLLCSILRNWRLATLLSLSYLFSQRRLPMPHTLEEVKKEIIQNSIQNYSGNCPCPYNRASNGSRCGKRSAWSKPGGYSPICYSEDVTESMVRKWLNTKHNVEHQH